jgi:hypothetical protein
MSEVTKVTIPIPLPFQRNFGVHATTHHTAMRLMQRYTKADHDILQRQAARLGITLSSFIKESAVNMAKALEVQEKENAQHDLRSG